MLEVTIEVSKGTAVAKESDGAESKPADVDFDRLRLKTIGVFTERLTSDEIRKRLELETLGEHLYAGLFTGDVREFLERHLRSATRDDPLRLRLRLPERRYRASDVDAQLADMPWEYLFCPSLKNGFFLTTRVMLVLSRYLPPSGDERKPEPNERELRVGVVCANPMDKALPSIDVAGPLKTLRELPALRKSIRVDVLENPTLEDVERWLREFRPHVLHYFGHGGWDQEKDEAKVVLAGPDGWADDVTDSELATAMEAADHTPSAIVLQLPERSGGRGIEPNLARLGPGLIRNGVPAVVATQHPFSADAAKHFCEAFYEALADADSIERAVTVARGRFQRRVSGALDSRMFGTPVLYARAYSPLVQAPVVEADEAGAAGGREWEPSAQPVTPATLAERAPSASGARPGVTDLGTSTPPASNGGATPSGPVRSWPIVMAGMRAERSASPPLDPVRKGQVRKWYKQLGDEFLAQDDAGADDVADAIQLYWCDGTDDKQLRAIASAMEETARKQAW